MYDNFDYEIYENNGQEYQDNLDSEYLLNQPISNPQELSNNTISGQYPERFFNIFFSLVILTFTSVQLVKCYYRIENYIVNRINERNQRINNRRPLNINSINTLVVCEELPDNTCSVCLEEFKEDDIIKKLNCNHIFHKDCLEPWLNNNRNCPLCRQNII